MIHSNPEGHKHFIPYFVRLSKKEQNETCNYSFLLPDKIQLYDSVNDSFFFPDNVRCFHNNNMDNESP